MAKAVLFDLDGTLADTAPDLAAAVNRLCLDRGKPGLPVSQLRPYTSQGVRGMLFAALDITPESPDYEQLAQQFLYHYEQALCVHTRLFPGMAALLDQLDAQKIRWGIVTNKRQRLTLPLIEALGYRQRAACIVSGDSATQPKPAPQPMYLAAELLGIPAKDCLFVGDDYRDIAAGKASAMETVAVRFGYLGVEAPIETWGADHIVDHPDEIIQLCEPC